MMHSSRRMQTFSSPTCEDLGLPHDAVDYEAHDDIDGENSYSKPGYLLPHCDPQDQITLNGLKYEHENPNNPFSPFCRIPLPNPYGCFEYGMEPAFIRKRNERERERVRCVNDGYARLREHLPIDHKPEKRVSKVETLRGAIRYIKQLQTLLDQVDANGSEKKSGREPANLKKRKYGDETNSDCKQTSDKRKKICEDERKARRS